MSHDRGSGKKGGCSSNEARQNVLTAASSVDPTDSEDYDFIKVCVANLDSSHSPACRRRVGLPMVLNTPPQRCHVRQSWRVFHSILLRPGSAHRYKTRKGKHAGRSAGGVQVPGRPACKGESKFRIRSSLCGRHLPLRTCAHSRPATGISTSSQRKVTAIVGCEAFHGFDWVGYGWNGRASRSGSRSRLKYGTRLS